MAIGIRAKKAPEGYDLGASKFFGTPTVPAAWDTAYEEDVIFFCQIRMADLAELDRENRLPHEGYLYIFLHTEEGKYHLTSTVRYADCEPGVALDDFNGEVEGYEKYTQAWLMEFFEAEDDAVCTRLFGTPSDWNYPDPPPELLFQYDPLDGEIDFLDDLDGFLYFFFGPENTGFDGVTLHSEYT